jgi:hypothetical protein
MLLEPPRDGRGRLLRVAFLKEGEVAEERFDQEVAIHVGLLSRIRPCGSFLSSDPPASNLESDKIMTEALLFPFRCRPVDFGFLQGLVRAEWDGAIDG